MKRVSIYGAVLLWLATGWSSAPVCAQPVKPVNTIRFLTLDQKPLQLTAFPKRLLVLVFLSPDCPVCQNYITTLNTIQHTYGANVSVLGIFPGKSYALSDYKHFKSEYAVDFNLLMDRPNALRNILKASITPEVFLLDAKRRVLYSGAIDDRMAGLGRRRTNPTVFYLTDAIRAYQNGQPIDTPRTQAIGCYINDF